MAARPPHVCPDCDYTTTNKSNFNRHLGTCKLSHKRRNEEGEASGSGTAPKLPRLLEPIENLYRGPDDFAVQRVVDRPTYSADRITPQAATPDYGQFLMDIADTATYIIEQERRRHTALKYNLSMKVNFFSAKNPDIEQSFVLNEDVVLCTASTNVYPQTMAMCNRIEQQIDSYTSGQSGWVIQGLVWCDVHIYKFKPSRGLSYFPLPDILANKGAIINVQNKDNRCFMWSILVGIYLRQNPQDTTHLEKISKYKHLVSVLDFTGIVFPVVLTDVEKFERLNDLPVNIYGYERELHILHLTNRREDIDRIINLMLISNGPKSHYCYIKDLNRLLQCQSKSEHRHHVCPFCLFPFTTKLRLDKHLLYCTTGNQRQQLPQHSTLEFRNVKNQIWSPLIFIADFECFLESTGVEATSADQTRSFTIKKQTHVPNSFALLSVIQCGCGSEDLFEDLMVYRAPDAVDTFLEETLKRGKKHQKRLDVDCRMMPTSFTWAQFNAETNCHICQKVYGKPCRFRCKCASCRSERKIREHCHFCGRFRGSAHSKCNIQLIKQRTINVVFHNLRRYDAHIIMRQVAPFANKHKLTIDCIPKGVEDYLSFSLRVPHKLAWSGKTIHWNLRFIDSFQLLSTSLATLVENLVGPSGQGEGNFCAMKEFIPNDNLRKLLLRKGIYPYDFVTDWNVFSLSHLPPPDSFYNKLTEESITDADYKHAQEVWSEALCTEFSDYHDLYLKTDVLLLADVFQHFRKTCMAPGSYGLDPAHYISLPSYTMDAALKMTKVKLELLEDPESYSFFEDSIRGGVSVISQRYAKANNPYLGAEYDSTSPNNYIMYWDVNNLYGWAMEKPLPISGFRFLDVEEIEQLVSNLNNLRSDDEDGYVLEVDLFFPPECHDKLNDYPPAPEPLEITNDMLSNVSKRMLTPVGLESRKPITKLCPNLFPKSKYVIHYLNLKCYLRLGVLLVKTHRVMTFKQSTWLQIYMNFNTVRRGLATNDFDRDFHKKANNSAYGKFIENIRKYKDIRLITTEKALAKLVSNPRFKFATHLGNELIAVAMQKEKVVLGKPIYVGYAVLEISKICMYNFHYDFIAETFGDRAKLLFTDTDSFAYQIQTNDIYEDLQAHQDKFDNSVYAKSHPLYSEVNKKRLGRMKDECASTLISEFVGLRSKMYSIRLMGEGAEIKKAKGVKRSVVKKQITHKDFYDVLMNQKVLRHRMMRFQSKNHIIHTIEQQKISLSFFDDKRVLLDPLGIKTLSYGHYKCAVDLCD